MKKLISILTMAFLFSFQPAVAHDDHHHDISEKSAIELGKKTASTLSVTDAGLGFGKLPANWNSVPMGNVKLHKKGDGYYIVSVNNAAEKKVLYVLMSSAGEVYDANFTGEFKNIK